jgi:hypothetical protein
MILGDKSLISEMVLSQVESKIYRFLCLQWESRQRLKLEARVSKQMALEGWTENE